MKGGRLKPKALNESGMRGRGTLVVGVQDEEMSRGDRETQRGRTATKAKTQKKTERRRSFTRRRGEIIKTELFNRMDRRERRERGERAETRREARLI